VGPLFRVKPSARLRAAVLALGTTPLALGSAAAAEETPSSEIASTLLMGAPLAAPSPYQVQKVGNQGVKLTSKNAENSYAITVLGSNTQTANTPVGMESWQKSVGVQVQGKLGSFVKTDFTTRFTELESSYDFGPFGPRSANALGVDRRGLEEFSLTTQFLGDRVSVTSARRASDYGGLDPALTGRGGVYEQEKFNAWVWRSDRSSLSVEGTSSRVDSGFQNLMQAMQTKSEESQQIKSKFSYGRAGFFVGHRDAASLSPDTGIALQRQSDIETGASLRLSDLRKGPLLYLLPDSVWVSTNRGSVVQGDPLAYEARPLEKSSVGMTRAWGYGSVNMNYWQSAVDTPAIADEQWRSHGMDVGGTLRSGRLSMSGNVSFYTADTMAALGSSAESNVNGYMFLTYSRAAWPKLSAGVTNYEYQAAFLNYGGLEQSNLMRYEVGVDSTPLLSAWRDPGAQLKFIASYQDNSSRSQWSQADTTTAMQNVFFGFKFTRSLLP
jgi:hypothetical protein